MKNYKILLCVFILAFSIRAFPQVENIPSDHPVYDFLFNLSVQGVLSDYDDIILPLSRKEISNYLEQANDKKSQLSSVEKDILEIFSKKIFTNTEAASIIAWSERFDQIISDYRQKHLYFFKDSLLTFFVDPTFDYSLIYSSQFKRSSNILNYGGEVNGSYNNWLGFRLKATNGIVLNNRSVALYDKRVEQSFSFNQTGLNYFDGTEGYLRLQKGIVGLQMGRERIYWGRGNIDKIFLGSNPPLFDFLKFNIAYKKFRFDFIHGWLTQKPEFIFIDTIPGHLKFKDAKYFAISRFGYSANSDLSFGISQIIVYANRPFEAAYLNPFLFWESAQRSLNDLDNSFLGFDVSVKPFIGFQLDFSVLLDDINFDKIGSGEWNTSSNALAFNFGGTFVSPLLPKNWQLKLQYVQIRPYMFSHQGKGESLVYSNNGYILGTEQPPNSVRFNSELDISITPYLGISLGYNITIHGQNLYGHDDRIMRNVGGNPFEPRTILDSETAYFLDGEKTYMHAFSSRINYEMFYGIFLNMLYEHRSNQRDLVLKNDNIFRASIILYWN